LDLACQHGEIWAYDYLVTGAALSPDLLSRAAAHGCTVIKV